MQSALAHPVEFAKNRVTGGVGVSLATDPVTGLPRVEDVFFGSPAHRAGLCVGDLITRVDGLATTGKPLSEIMQTIRGFPNTKVTITVQRSGSITYEYIIRRRSWKTIDELNRL